MSHRVLEPVDPGCGFQVIARIRSHSGRGQQGEGAARIQMHRSEALSCSAEQDMNMLFYVSTIRSLFGTLSLSLSALSPYLVKRVADECPSALCGQ